MSTNRARKDYTDFVCDFGNITSMNNVFEREGIKFPEGWIPDPSNFVVTEDCGRIMRIKFCDWDKVGDCSMGEEFEIEFDDAHYWA